MTNKLSLFPLTAEVNDNGHLTIGGCDTVNLAAEFGTPLYLFDEQNLRRMCADFRDGFGRRYAGTTIIYACKAFINQALAGIFQEEGLGLDAVSAGELSIARSAGFPMNRVYFHGNNKSAGELGLALEWGVGRIVIDNFHEMALLNDIAGERRCRTDVLLRLSPGIDPHTHKYITTGNIDSKFGFPVAGGEEAVVTALAAPNLNLTGLHFHIGSLIFETEPYRQAVEIILDFAADMKRKHSFELEDLNIGGGVAIQYSLDAPALPVDTYAEKITAAVIQQCQRLELTLPHLIVEPGRSIVGRSGAALYTAGAIKDIPGIRRYISVDGGMADNIRPALYGARYEAVIANKINEPDADTVTIAGKFCESGDVLVRDIALPPASSGDIIAIPDCGAYCLSMASNYNASLKPPVILVKDGKARLIRRRETLEDLTRCDLT
ncbi:diaminopimelate decarboxylase [Chloroflexota bacterium]